MLLAFLALETGKTVVCRMRWTTWIKAAVCWRTYLVGNILSLVCELFFMERRQFWGSEEVSVMCWGEIVKAMEIAKMIVEGIQMNTGESAYI